MQNKKTNYNTAQNDETKHYAKEKCNNRDVKGNETRELMNDKHVEGVNDNTKDDSKFSSVFVQTITDESVINDIQCCIKKDNVKSQSSEKITEPNPSYQDDTVDDPKEDYAEGEKSQLKSCEKEVKDKLSYLDIEPGDAVYASVNKNRKIENKQLMLVTK